jgi:hypothetical protein
MNRFVSAPPVERQLSQYPRDLNGGQHHGRDAIHPGIGFLSEKSQVRPHGRWNTVLRGSARTLTLSKDGRQGYREGYGQEDGPARRARFRWAVDVASAMKAAPLPKRWAIPSDQGGFGRRRQRHEGRALGRRDREGLLSWPHGSQSQFRRRYVSTWRNILTQPRHIEIQVLGDSTAMRSIWASATARSSAATRKWWKKRRVPRSSAEERAYIGNLAAEGAPTGLPRRGYDRILFEDGKFYFMEMNTRIAG